MTHGTRSTFINKGCRCLPCRSANSRYHRQRMVSVRRGEWEGLNSSQHTKRLIVKLLHVGFTKKELAKRIGVTKIVIKPRIHEHVEQRFQRLYDLVTIE